MPELPEVETVVRDLRPLVVGRTIAVVRSGERKLRKPWDAAWNAALQGCRVEAIRRRGKWIVVELAGLPSPVRGGAGGGIALKHLTPRPPSLGGKGEQEKPRLVVHLGMTGQFTAVDAATEQPDHLHLTFELDGGRELRFRDPRRFGSATVFSDDAAVEAFFTDIGLGPEPFGLDRDYFRTAVRGTGRTLKAILLDQGIVAGVGNIYANEACFRAKLHPTRAGDTLTPEECDRLRKELASVLKMAIRRRGSSIGEGSGDYVGGKFQKMFGVYGRGNEPCRVCTSVIERMTLTARATYFCPSCQPKG